MGRPSGSQTAGTAEAGYAVIASHAQPRDLETPEKDTPKNLLASRKEDKEDKEAYPPRSDEHLANTVGHASAARRPRPRRPQRAEEVACPPNTASMAAWAHFSPSAPDTPIAPMT